MIICKNCGKQIDETKEFFCSNCGEFINSSMQQPNEQNYTYQQPIHNEYQNYVNAQQPVHPMKWFKFLIYFSLFISALSFLVDGIEYITGHIYEILPEHQVSGEFIYTLYGNGLRILDVCYGIICVLLSVYIIVVRFALAGFKKHSPNMLLASYGIEMIMSILYASIAGIISGQEYVTEIISCLIGSGLVIWLNYIYFNKRSYLFTN